jgi:acid phosphatase type 7
MKRAVLVLLSSLGLLVVVGGTAQAARPDEPVRPPDTVQQTGLLVAAVGDIACSRFAAVCHDDQTAALIAQHNPAAVLVLGDDQYEKGSLADFNASYDGSYGQFKSITYPIPGNHEYLTAGATGYYDYFGPVAHGAPGYYAFDLNGWRFYALNSECSKIDCAAERTWMVNDIKTHRVQCQLFFTHHPRYSSGSEHGSATIAKRFWVTGYANKFDLALAGHDHDYERFAPMDPNGVVTSSGIRSFVSGLGGKSISPLNPPVTGSEFAYAADFGVLFLTIEPGSYTWEFRTTSDAVVDSGSGTCQ